MSACVKFGVDRPSRLAGDRLQTIDTDRQTDKQAGRRHGSLASSGKSVDFLFKKAREEYIDTLYRGTLC